MNIAARLITPGREVAALSWAGTRGPSWRKPEKAALFDRPVRRAWESVVERAPDAAGWATAIVDLLQRAKLIQPDELATEIEAATRGIGVEVAIYLADLEQERLQAVPQPGKPARPPVPLEGTVAGRAFTAVATQSAEDQGDSYRLWVPMIDGSERLGVAEVVTPRRPDDPAAFCTWAELFMGLVGHLVTVKYPYGDALQLVRRTRPMSPASELVTQMLPPLTFSAHRIVVSAVLEPSYDVGGDAYDYAVDGATARVLVLDAMGRGLKAGLTSATALAAIRAARRGGQDLHGMCRAADVALAEQFPELRFVTGVLADLNLDSGELRYINAGHPAPMLLRGGRMVRTLPGGRRMPLGVPDGTAEIGVENLAPGDRLLIYTDGVTEAYDRTGDRFGLERLGQLAEACFAERLPAPETLRRLARTVLAHQGGGRPTDDATFLLIEWSREAAERTQP